MVLLNYYLFQMYNSLEWPIRIFFYKYADIPKTNGSRPKVRLNC